MADHVAHWYMGSAARQRYPNLLCEHMGFYYALGISPSGGPPMLNYDRETIFSVPPGTLLIWEPRFSPRNSNSDRAVTLEEVRHAGWEEEPEAAAVLAAGPEEDEGWHIFHSKPIKPGG
jgi:hypothetical protein